MKFLKAFAARFSWGRTKIRKQMLLVYTCVLLIPLTVAGVMLMSFGQKTLEDHSLELLAADNQNVKSLLSSVTTRVYGVSEDLGYDSTLKRILSEDYQAGTDYVAAVNTYGDLDTVLMNYAEVERILIYTDNPTARSYKQFRPVTAEIAEAEWYRKALEGSNAFWVSIPSETSYTSENSNLCLIRRIPLPDCAYHAVAVITVSDSYIHSRVDSSGSITAVSVDDIGVVYSTRRNLYGQPLPVPVDYSQDLYRYSGKTEVEGIDSYVAVSTSYLHKTSSKLYIVSVDGESVAASRRVSQSWLVILLLAILVPGVVLVLFADYFSGRVLLLRKEMRKARLQDYNMISRLGGNDELTEAFEDLKVMVRDVEEKNARMYEAELKEQELQNKQQLMEYKMLASQINPHYLYNALETIRMKALTGGDREVADAIKILGKTLHYVMENTGTAFTTLKKELAHVENYLSIQKLRFGERINYELEVEPGLDTRSCRVLPLLLQPVVENAVVHGLEAVEGIGLIRVSVSLTGQTLQITVRDNGRGMVPEELRRVRSMLQSPEPDPDASVALYNIHRRLGLCYGKEYGVCLESADGSGTCVKLTMPREAVLGKE